MFASYTAAQRTISHQHWAGLTSSSLTVEVARESLISGYMTARTNRSCRFLGRWKAMMERDAIACLSRSESCTIWWYRLLVHSSMGKFGWYVTTSGTRSEFCWLLHEGLLSSDVVNCSIDFRVKQFLKVSSPCQMMLQLICSQWEVVLLRANSFNSKSLTTC